MRKIKLLCLIFISLSVTMMSGCGAVMDYLYPPDEERNPAHLSVYDSAGIEMKILLDAIERKDAEAIRDEFSVYAKENISDLDGKIDRLIEEFPDCTEYEISAHSAGKNRYGKKEDAYMPMYDFIVDGKEYRMIIVYFVTADFDETKLGWHLIQLYERSDPTNSSSMYRHDNNDDPDILLWDYTKEQ